MREQNLLLKSFTQNKTKKLKDSRTSVPQRHTAVGSLSINSNKRIPYLECCEHRADMDSKIQHANNDTHHQVGLQTLTLWGRGQS